MTHGCKAMNHMIFLRPTKGGGICSYSAIINFVNTVHWNVWEISDLVIALPVPGFTVVFQVSISLEGSGPQRETQERGREKCENVKRNIIIIRNTGVPFFIISKINS